MLKIIFTYSILLSLTAKAQTSDSLIGNWKFKDIYKSETLDSGKRANLRMMFGDFTLNLKFDNQYTAFFGGQEDGTWTYDPVLRQLILTNDKGEDKINIIEITPGTVALELKRGKILVFTKPLIQ